jgi:hypothetical protein
MSRARTPHSRRVRCHKRSPGLARDRGMELGLYPFEERPCVLASTVVVGAALAVAIPSLVLGPTATGE